MKHYQTYQTDIDEANRQLQAMSAMCLLRLNGICWEKCRGRDYCRPDLRGLETIVDLRGFLFGLDAQVREELLEAEGW